MGKESITKENLRLIEKFNRINNHLKTDGISTDIDSTEFASEVTALKLYNNLTQESRTMDELTDRYIMVKWLKDLGYGDPLNTAINIWNNSNEISKLQPSAGSLILSKYLYDNNVDLHRITARPGWTEIVDATYKCYEVRMPWVNKELIHIQEGDQISSQFKINTVLNCARYHFDDAQEEAEKLCSAGVVCVLIPQPWNKYYKSGNPRLLTFNKALSVGLPSLGISEYDFQHTPKLIQAYFILSDYILKNVQI